MAIWPSRRKKEQTPAVPKEVTNYYQAEQRDRRGLAWLLGLATLFVTVIVAVGLFLTGRWAYRKLANNDTSQPETTQTAQTPTAPTGSSSPNANEGNGGSSTTENNTSDNTSNGSNSSQGGNETGGTTTSGSSEDSNLPDTGPGNTLAIFTITTIVAGSGHYIVSKKRRSI